MGQQQRWFQCQVGCLGGFIVEFIVCGFIFRFAHPGAEDDSEADHAAGPHWERPLRRSVQGQVSVASTLLLCPLYPISACKDNFFGFKVSFLFATTCWLLSATSVESASNSLSPPTSIATRGFHQNVDKIWCDCPSDFPIGKTETVSCVFVYLH